MNQTHKSHSAERNDPHNKSIDELQDWVCLKCNNLNYSFRTKCNRCKVQSRVDNQQILYADYYYYTHYYPYHTQQKQSNKQMDQHTTQCSRNNSPQKKVSMSESELSLREDDHLPSVSPLIKRYRAREQKTSRKVKKGIFGQKLFQAQSWNESELPVLNLTELCKDLCLTDEEQASEQFAKSVQQMII